MSCAFVKLITDFWRLTGKCGEECWSKRVQRRIDSVARCCWDTAAVFSRELCTLHGCAEDTSSEKEEACLEEED